MGVAIQPACGTAAGVTNGWVLKTKVRYAARIIDRFPIIFHISLLVFCLVYNLMPSPCLAVPCRVVYGHLSRISVDNLRGTSARCL